MRDAWRDGKVSFDGKHYQVDGAIVEPKPLQDGGLPLWIAGGGEKVTLRIAAKYAQYTNFTSEPDGFAHKSAVLAEHCRDVGTDYDAIVRSANFNAVIGESDADVKARVERLRARQVAKADAAAVDGMLNMVTSPDSASGTTEQAIEKLSGCANSAASTRSSTSPRRPTTARHRTVRARGYPGGELVAVLGAGPGGNGGPAGGGGGPSKYPGGGGPVSG